MEAEAHLKELQNAYSLSVSKLEVRPELNKASKSRPQFKTLSVRQGVFTRKRIQGLI
jgi:hypothetical protein